ncbi:VOC family protein [Arthrobacter oryzae]|jgi:predicted enzyme related to lactoylglutathione lyase|uniref:VOC family protein n=1 Tax=Arthrobacter oryzae TaxID=409290 RepID=UPI002785D380|nr:VOC family protein [Arthrobacter oryzae]MDQ0074865.1 putative enzyme related to lactoylglutathione lyase [Arthrobacter oryzae]
MAGIVHFEIPADDQGRATEFYKAAFDWTINPMPEMDYNVVLTTPTDETTGMPKDPGAINGGLFAREGELKTPIITVDVEDIDASLARIESLGGAVVKPKDAIPGMGYYAYFKDPEGNVLGLWQTADAREGGVSPESAANDIGA